MKFDKVDREILLWRAGLVSIPLVVTVVIKLIKWWMTGVPVI